MTTVCVYFFRSIIVCVCVCVETLLMPYVLSGLFDQMPDICAAAVAAIETIGEHYERDHADRVKVRGGTLCIYSKNSLSSSCMLLSVLFVLRVCV